MKINEDSQRGSLTLSKRPHSQISCSRALVLMAIVNRMCGTKSCEMGQRKKANSLTEFNSNQVQSLKSWRFSCVLPCRAASQTILSELSLGLPFGLANWCDSLSEPDTSLHARTDLKKWMYSRQLPEHSYAEHL